MLKIALLQMRSFSFDQSKNLKKAEKFCRQAKTENADIVLFPEMWNIGYTPYDESVLSKNYDSNLPAEIEKQNAWQKYAISLDGEYVQHFKNLAKQLDMAIAITLLEKAAQKPKNSMLLIDRFGEINLHYSKVHLCDFSMEAACDAGNDFYVSELDTQHGNVKIGGMICFDREFPESARILALQGAEVILVPNACEIGQNRKAQIQTRAYENMCVVAVCNYPVPKNNGHSLVFDGMAFDNHGARNMLLVEADESETIVMAEINLQQLRDYRQREVWGVKNRKPNSYKPLLS